MSWQRTCLRALTSPEAISVASLVSIYLPETGGAIKVVASSVIAIAAASVLLVKFGTKLLEQLDRFTNRLYGLTLSRWRLLIIRRQYKDAKRLEKRPHARRSNPPSISIKVHAGNPSLAQKAEHALVRIESEESKAHHSRSVRRHKE